MSLRSILQQGQTIGDIATDLTFVRRSLDQIQQDLKTVEEQITDVQTAIGSSKRPDGAVESDLLKCVKEINEKVTLSVTRNLFIGALASLIGAIAGVLIVAVLQKLGILGPFFQ